jgi:hypothetical protein
MPSIIDLHIPVLMNTDGAHVHLTAETDTDVVWEGRGNSITKGMIEMLWRFMSRSEIGRTATATGWANRRYPLPLSPDPKNNTGRKHSSSTASVAFWNNNATVDYLSTAITNVTNNGSGVIRLTTASITATPAFAAVYGVLGVEAANGIWALSKINNTTWDLVGSTFPPGAVFDGSANPILYGLVPDVEAASSPIYVAGHYSHVLNSMPVHPGGFIVGKSNRAVSIHDNWLYDMIPHGVNQKGRLTYSASILSPPTVIGPTTEMAEVRQFLNEHADEITLREIGMIGNLFEAGSNVFGAFLMTRDLVNIPMPFGASVSITYRLRTNCPAEGGFTRQFLELWFREYARVSREAKSTVNANHTNAANMEQMWLNPIGGRHASMLPGENIGAHYGVVVGTSSKDCEPNDYMLRNADDSPSRIPHGTGAGQLYYGGGGCIVGDPVIVGGKCAFDIGRIFENRSGADITVREVGLVCNNIGGAAGFLLARHKLATPVTVPSGHALRVTYEIGATVGA